MAAGLLAAPAAPSHAAAHTVVSAGYLYAPADLSIARGDTVDYVNLDPVPHNITSERGTATGELLFASDTINAGERAAVRGVDKLKPGTYGYFCTLHEQMRGTITVTDAQPGVDLPDLVATPSGVSVASPTSVTHFQGSLYVTSYARGEVVRLPIVSSGLLGAPVTYATGFDQPLGAAFGPDGTLYVSDSHAVGTGRVGRVRALPPGGGAAGSVGQVVVDGLPNGRHATNNLAVHGGRLYITNGNNTDDGTGTPPEQPLSGTLLSVPLSARNVPPKAGPKLSVEARGLRNPYDVAFRPGTSEAWFPTNGPDAMDPYGEDLLHKVDVRGGTADYGFPACVWRAGLGRGPQCTAKHRRPELALGLHVSANGVAFGPAGAPWDGDLFIAEYGNNPGESTAGHKVVRVPMTGARAGQPVDVITLPSPLDLTFGPPGTGLYVADFGTGQILLLRPEG
jgi:glucose/arabinose dehydrogenase